MFFVLIVQRVEHRHGHLRLPRVARRGFFLPEPVGATEVQQVVAAYSLAWWSKTAERRKGKQSLVYGISSRTHMRECYFAAQPVLAVSSQSDVPLKPRRASSRAPGACVAALFTRILGESAEPT